MPVEWLGMNCSMRYRVLDLIISLSLLPVCFVLILLLSLITILLDQENPIFAQTRVGKFEKRFQIFKLRTFKSCTPERASHEVDPRMLLRVGRFYRAVKLDELPQILNVIFGDMSLVGPRPCLPSQKRLIEMRASASVFDVKPGITGLSQIHGVDMRDSEVLLESDIKMINNMSLPLYFKILYQTVCQIVRS